MEVCVLHAVWKPNSIKFKLASLCLMWISASLLGHTDTHTPVDTEVIFIGSQSQMHTHKQPHPRRTRRRSLDQFIAFLTSHTQVALRLAFHNIFLSKTNLQQRDYVKQVHTASNHLYTISLRGKKIWSYESGPCDHKNLNVSHCDCVNPVVAGDGLSLIADLAHVSLHNFIVLWIDFITSVKIS